MRRLFILIAILVFADGIVAGEVSYVKSTDTYKKIRTAIDKIHVIDTHEHYVPEEKLLKEQEPDFFALAGDYYGADDKRYMDKTLSVEERWESFLPVYKKFGRQRYLNSISRGIERIYGVKVSDSESIKKINENMRNFYKPGIFKKVLYDIGKIDCVFVHSRWRHGFPKADYPDFFRGGRALDKMMVFTAQEDIEYLEEGYNIKIHSLDDLKRIYRRFVEESIESGVIGFKYTGAYLRSLDFLKPDREQAELLLKKLLGPTGPKWRWAGGEFSLEEGKQLSSYCMHMMLGIIEETGRPVAVHTGILGFRKCDVRRSNPQLLIPLFREYENINFELYHSGFPYVTEFVELAKSWPNVYLNMCWAQNLSPSMARGQLSEMLECVPINKIIAYGGDSLRVENTIGDLEITKENCAIVLTEKVLDGYFTQQQAIEYADRILRRNAVELYKLELPER